jgi:tetratricopeptide (TPR) repeat protein
VNWEIQLAAAMAPDERHLLSEARRARDLAGQSRHGAALEKLWALLLAVSRHGSARQRAFLWLHMGHVYRHWMIDVAFKFFRDARRLSRESGFVHGEMVAESSLGQLYIDWKDPERALPHFERCLVLAGECAGIWWQRDVLVEVITCLESLGRTDRARAERGRLALLDAELLDDLWGGSGAHDAGAQSPKKQSAEHGTRRGDGRCRS